MARIKTVTWHLPWEAFVSEIFFAIFRSYSCDNNGYTQWDVCNIALVHNYSTRTSCIVQHFYEEFDKHSREEYFYLNTLPVIGGICRLLITDNFGNQQTKNAANNRQNIGPDLDLNCLTL